MVRFPSTAQDYEARRMGVRVRTYVGVSGGGRRARQEEHIKSDIDPYTHIYIQDWGSIVSQTSPYFDGGKIRVVVQMRTED